MTVKENSGSHIFSSLLQKFMVKRVESSVAVILMIHHQTLVQYQLLMNLVPSVNGSQQRREEHEEKVPVVFFRCQYTTGYILFQ